MGLQEPDDGVDASALVDLDRNGTVLLRVHVQPGARRPGIDGCHGDALRVRVGAAPERGRANAAVCAAVAQALGMRSAEVRLVAGATGRRKTLALAGLTLEATVERLERLLGTGQARASAVPPDVED